MTDKNDGLEKVEFDVTEEAWEVYQLLYQDNIDFESPDNEGIVFPEKKRSYIETEFKTERGKGSKINFSGETDFNFKNNGNVTLSVMNRYRLFCEKADKEKCNKLQETLNELMYSVLNVSLMPQTGSMQAVKKGIGNDRPDTFVWALDAYYKDDVQLLLNFATANNTESLKEYLSLFQNAGEYCGLIYHIKDDKLVSDLIESGKKPIDSAERAAEYIRLAFRFWSQKVEFLSGKVKKGSKMDATLKKAEKQLKKAVDLFDELEKLREPLKIPYRA